MNEKIMELAIACQCEPSEIISSEGYVYPSSQSIESFYKAAFNAGIEAAVKIATDYIKHGGYQFLKEIHKLEMKP